MSDIRAALERLIELHNADGAWGLHWDDAIAAARAALAEPVGEGPTNDELAAAALDALAHYPYASELPYFLTSDSPEYAPFMVAIRAAIAAARAALAAEPVGEGEGPAAWLYKGDPDFDGTTWRDNWRVTTDEQVARFKADPGCPVPLFRRSAAPPAPEVGEVGELAARHRRRAGEASTTDSPDQAMVRCPETCWVEIRRIADGKLIYSNYRKGDLRLPINEPPAEPPAPAGGLVERLAGQPLNPAVARAAIREVAAWLDQRGMHGCSLWLREEADRCR